MRRHAKGNSHSRCGYEFPGMILLQVYLYTYSSLTGVTFELLPLGSYKLTPVMLPLFETLVVKKLSLLS